MQPGANAQITPFNFNGANVRTITDAQGEPWFILKDVCELLDLKNAVSYTHLTLPTNREV